MPVPTSIADLSTVAASNSPAGSDQVLPMLDDYLRAHAAFIKQTSDASVKKSGDTMTGGLTTNSLTVRNGVSEADIFLGGSGAYFYGNQTAIGIYKAGGGAMSLNVLTGAFNVSGGLGAAGAISTNSSIYAATTITAGGNITAYSDARLKTDITTITDALALVKRLRGVRYVKGGEPGVGVVAQEMREVVPEVVQDGEYLSVAYGNLVGVLIEAVKELSIQVDRLRARR